MTQRVAVLGATGFVGSACVTAARARGADIVTVAAPRLAADATDLDGLTRELAAVADVVSSLADRLQDADVVVNAAGLAMPRARSSAALTGANALLPAVVHTAVRHVGRARFVHLSSAAVQGSTEELDETWEHRPFSPYSSTKALGERYLQRQDDENTVVYRATSVQGVNRDTTRSLVRFAASRMSSVAGDGSAPSPQVLVENLADAVVHVGTSDDRTPALVLHPWEGLSCRDVLYLLGGTPPRRVSPVVARSVIRAAWAARRPGTARRMEMVWFGQRQAETWLDRTGWRPRLGQRAWQDLGAEIRRGSQAGGSAQ